MHDRLIELYGGTVQLGFQGPPKHRYEVMLMPEGGDPSPWIYAPNVTGITGMIDDGKSPRLMGWAVKQALLKIEAGLQPGIALDEIGIQNLIKRGRGAHRSESAKAANIGTLVHEWVEEHVRAKMSENTELLPALPKNKTLRGAAEAFLAWEAGHKVEYLFAERMIYSVDHHYSGTVDIGAIVDGAHTVVDIKTSSHLYEEFKLQTAAYIQALNEEFEEDWTTRIVVQLPKTGSAKHTEYHLENMAEYDGGHSLAWDIEAFLAARTLYRRFRGD
jgi:hypothetical protein